MDAEHKIRLIQNLRGFLAREGDKLYDHQREALTRICTFLGQPVGSQIRPDLDSPSPKRGDWLEVVSATGTGKTRIFGSMAKGFHQPTLILTPRNLLNEQTKREFCEEIGISPDQVGIYDSKQPERQKQLALQRPFLISTYQSLPSLMKRQVVSPDPKHPNYRPVVILDEVHAAQGLATAKLIRSFLDTCLVAGFTATDAGAGETLFKGQIPVYDLGIVPAIERDILCHGVRTGVLDVRIDEDWVRQFKKTARGDYDDEDVHRFARNPSVIKGAVEFHLTQEDEQLGRLHRLPTIFFTHGVDAAQAGAEQFNRRAEELGIDARADFISGEMSQNERNAKLEAFRTGKIQALWNDRVLEMGFDDKDATVCYSLKPTLLSATPTQQMGRVTRRQSAGYRERYGQDKVALAINVRAPGMNPFLFGEVIGGRPELYSLKHSRSRNKEEERRTPASRVDNVEIHLDYEDMAAVLSQAVRARDSGFDKTGEWLGVMEMVARTGRNYKGIKRLYEALETALAKRQPSQSIVAAAGIAVPVEQLAVKQTPGGQRLYVHEQALPQFQRQEKTAEWLAAYEMKSRVRSWGNYVANIYAGLQKAWDRRADGQTHIEAEGIRIPVEWAGYKQPATGYQAFCLHENALPLLQTREKTAEWLGIWDMIGRTGRSHDFIQPIYQELEEAWTNRQEGQTYFELPRSGLRIPANWVDRCKPTKGAAVLCLHEQAVEIVEKLREYIPKTSEWLGCGDMAERTGRSPTTLSPIYQALREAWERRQEGQSHIEARGCRIPVEWASVRQAATNGKQVFCLHENAVGLFGRERPKSPEWLSCNAMSARVNRNLRDVYQEIRGAWEQRTDGQRYININNLSVPVEWIDIQDSKLGPVFCLHEKAATLLAKESPKTLEWLNSLEMAKGIQRSHHTVFQLYAALRSAWEQRQDGQTHLEARGVRIPIEWAGLRSPPKGKAAFCLHEQAVETLRQHFAAHSPTSRPARWTDQAPPPGDRATPRSIDPDSEHIRDDSTSGLSPHR
jgi:superfamily II DNA or RNA helicase